MPSLVYAITGDGMLHGLYVSNGEPSHAAIPFLPANTAARELIVIDNVAYAAAAPSCNAAPDSLIAIDVVSKEAARWKPESGTILGPAFGPDGTAYVTTSQGDLFALEPKTLAVKSRYRSEQGFAASPVLFEYQDKALIAAASKDGRIQVFDTAALDKPLASSAVGGAAPGSLATWQDQAGTRWILGATPDAVVAWKFTPAIERAWASRDIASPLAPIVVNGVVFTASPTTLYALDGATGAPLWNSGRTIAAPIRGGGLSAGGSQLYLGSSDGTLYVFGFPIEH
jgi:outer membrane protein assembly factor BamB